jgi:hypothetical protein
MTRAFLAPPVSSDVPQPDGPAGNWQEGDAPQPVGEGGPGAGWACPGAFGAGGG